MRKFFAALKTITVGVSLLSIVGCGPSVKEQVAVAYEEGYDAGYSEGHEKGHAEGRSEAIDCLRDEGGSAEDAADSCE